ncbi:hypothetical protein ABL78_5900 [Leptomonas seymouri]|uniref:Uncharacterized protein n=1 Tax=Leptomonas seymouri TaxID=5684 RepID=A0A0N1HUG3_LEPSE|nr:hypothetical protein ABL78_5900 [Leptomonas seymouri]|eukprot:KPI85038.1 hypothetical protein ABL78_5900 [Leptomonas seymouri]
MDALRNTLLEWLLTASPDSTIGANPDVWHRPKSSEVEGALGGHHAGDNRLASTWSACRHGDMGYPYHHNNTSFSRSAVFSSNHRSTHDLSNEEYDEQQHLRVALRSVVRGSTISSRTSADLRDSRNLTPSIQPDPSSCVMNKGDEGSEFESELGYCTPRMAVLPVSESNTEGWGVLTPLDVHRSEESDEQGASIISPLPPSKANAAAAAANGVTVDGTSPKSAAAHYIRSDGDLGDLPISPLKMPTASSHTRWPAAVDNSGDIRRSSLTTHAECEAPLPPPDASPKPFSLRSFESADPCVGETDDSSNHNSKCPDVPSRGQKLLRPSILVPPTKLQDGCGDDDCQFSRHLIPLRDVVAESIMEGDLSASDVPLRALHPDTGAFGVAIRVGNNSRRDVQTVEKESEAVAATQGLSVSTVIASVAENLSRSSPRSRKENSRGSNCKSVCTSATTVEQQRRPAVSTPANLSHLNTPDIPRRIVSPLHCPAPLMLDDHVVAHVLPHAAVVMVEDAPTTAVTAETATTTTAATSAARLPLLIPQLHCVANGAKRQSLLLRASKRFSAVQPQALSSSSPHMHTLNSLSGVSLGSMPHSFGAYPYQWMMASDPIGGAEISIRGTSPSSDWSHSTALMHDASPAAMSHPPSSCGTVSTLAFMRRSVSDSQLYATSKAASPQVSC